MDETRVNPHDSKHRGFYGEDASPAALRRQTIGFVIYMIFLCLCFFVPLALVITTD